MLLLLLQVTVTGLIATVDSPVSWSGVEICQGSAANGITQQQHHEVQDFKPPKHSFVDYSLYLLNNNAMPPYLQLVARWLPPEDADLPPDVYAEIDTPPDIAA